MKRCVQVFAPQLPRLSRLPIPNAAPLAEEPVGLEETAVAEEPAVVERPAAAGAGAAAAGAAAAKAPKHRGGGGFGVFRKWFKHGKKHKSSKKAKGKSKIQDQDAPSSSAKSTAGKDGEETKHENEGDKDVAVGEEAFLADAADDFEPEVIPEVGGADGVGLDEPVVVGGTGGEAVDAGGSHSRRMSV